MRKGATSQVVHVAVRELFTSTAQLGHRAEGKAPALNEGIWITLKSDALCLGLHWFLLYSSPVREGSAMKGNLSAKESCSESFCVSLLNFYFHLLCSRTVREFKTAQYTAVTVLTKSTVIKY